MNLRTQSSYLQLAAVPLFPGAVVLDTCMGLGYTAQGAAKRVLGSASSTSSSSSAGSGSSSRGDTSNPSGATVGRVVTIEYDEASIEMSAHNPWSQVCW